MRSRAIPLILLALLLLASCSRKPESYRFQKMLLGTVVNITVTDTGMVENVGAEIETVFARLTELDLIWSERQESSDLYKLYRDAGEAAHTLDKRTFTLLVRGTSLELLTNGAFNQRIGPITDLWGFHTDNPHIPEGWKIEEKLPLIKGKLLFADNTCLLSEKGMKLDIGGIGKGYGVDLAVENLIADGVNAGLVEAGGDLRTFGAPPDADYWRIGIRHPRKPEEFFGVLEVGACAVATSGDYQQYFEVEGKRYHHLIDPVTGYPAEGCVSATVIAKTCLEADAVSTALFVMGPIDAMKWLSEHREYEGIIIYFNGRGELVQKHSEGLVFEAGSGIFSLVEESQFADLE